MRYYVIMNGVNSLTIQGLAIRELPPTSKPLMRNIKEEIDGRNGDIITELGYSAYDKELEIGLYGESYDINDIIAFFNGKGTITFSDEPDKYYYYQILNQIDYEKLLKFKTASVVFHCQPFKYKVDEVPLEEEFEYVEGEGTDITLNNTSNAIFNEFDLKGNTEQDGTPTPTDPIEVETTTGNQIITICDKNLFSSQMQLGTIDNDTGQNANGGNSIRSIGYIRVQPNTTYTISSTMNYHVLIHEYNKDKSYIQYDGNYGSPRTFTTTENTYYIRVRSSAGQIENNLNAKYQLELGGTPSTYEEYKGNNYEINLGKNLFYINDCSLSQNGGVVSVSNGNTITITGTFSTDANFSFDSYVSFTNANSQLGNAITLSVQNILNEGTTSITPNRFFLGSINTLLYMQPNQTTGIVTKTLEETLTRCRLYVPAGTYNTTFNIQLEKGNQVSSFSPYFTPIELCKIGDYQDYFYEEDNKWYLHKEINKVVLNGSENEWMLRSSTSPNYIKFRHADILPSDIKDRLLLITNYFVANGGANDAPYSGNAICGNSSQYAKWLHVSIDNTIASDVATFKTWLSTHNVDVYYVQKTPTDEEITNEELINQLDALMLATSQDGQTNIIQSTVNLPFIIKVTALKQGTDHLIINNIGNIFAKPTLDLEGTGIVDIYLNDVEVFQVDLSVVNEIVLNTAEMEAYNPNTHQLANRQVTGDYSNFKLDVGENDLRFSGNLTKATVTYYQRWL